MNRFAETALGMLICAGPATQLLAAEFDCVIEPKQVLEIRSPLEGLVMKVNGDRGQFVRKGQELAVIDTSVDRAQAAIDKFRSELEGAVRSGESKVALTTKPVIVVIGENCSCNRVRVRAGDHQTSLIICPRSRPIAGITNS